LKIISITIPEGKYLNCSISRDVIYFSISCRLAFFGRLKISGDFMKKIIKNIKIADNAIIPISDISERFLKKSERNNETNKPQETAMKTIIRNSKMDLIIKSGPN